MKNNHFGEENFINEVELNFNHLECINRTSLQKEIPAFISLPKGKYQINNQTLEFVEVKKGVLNNLKLTERARFCSAGEGAPLFLGLFDEINASGQMGCFLTRKLLHQFSIIGTWVGVLEHGGSETPQTGEIQSPGPLGVLDDPCKKHQNPGNPELVFRKGLDEDVDSGNDLEDQSDEMAKPERVVLESESGDGVGAAEMEEKERGPEGEKVDIGIGIGLGLVVGNEADNEAGGPVGEEIG